MTSHRAPETADILAILVEITARPRICGIDGCTTCAQRHQAEVDAALDMLTEERRRG